MGEYASITLEELEDKKKAAEKVLCLQRRGMIVGNGNEIKTLENVEKELEWRKQHQPNCSRPSQGFAGNGRKVDLGPKKPQKKPIRQTTPECLRACLEPVHQSRFQKQPEEHSLKLQKTEEGSIRLRQAATSRSTFNGVRLDETNWEIDQPEICSSVIDKLSEDRQESMLTSFRKSTGQRMLDRVSHKVIPRFYGSNMAQTNSFGQHRHRIPPKQRQPKKEIICLEQSDEEKQSNGLLDISPQRFLSEPNHMPRSADLSTNVFYSESDLEKALGNETIDYGFSKTEVVTPHDLKALYPTEFLNDSCINLYIRIIEETCPHGERCHFFSTFVFPQLEKEIGHRGKKCRAPTKDVDIFEKDYLLFPVCKDAHWSLLIVCFPGESLLSKQKGREKRILHLDSLGGEGGHDTRRLCEVVKGYLTGEWERKKPPPTPMFHFMIDRVTTIPKQTNSFDCGVYLLIYLEFFAYACPKFLKRDLSASSDFPNFLKKDWFPSNYTGMLRSKLRIFIYDQYISKLSRDHAAIPIMQALKKDLLAGGKLYEGPSAIQSLHQPQQDSCSLSASPVVDISRSDDPLITDERKMVDEKGVDNGANEKHAVCSLCSEEAAPSSDDMYLQEDNPQACELVTVQSPDSADNDVSHKDEVVDIVAEKSGAEEVQSPIDETTLTLEETVCSSPDLDSYLADEDIRINLA